MKIRYAQKEMLTEDLKILDHKMEEIRKSQKIENLLITVFFIMLTYYISIMFPNIFITKVIDEVIGLIEAALDLLLFISLIAVVVYPWSRRDKKKEYKRIMENFVSTWGSPPQTLRFGNEFTFQDTDNIPWSHIKNETLFDEKKNDERINIKIDSDNRYIMIWKQQKAINDYQKSETKTYYILDPRGITQGDLINLRESFQFSIFEDLIPERIDIKIKSIFPRALVAKPSLQGAKPQRFINQPSEQKDFSETIFIYEDKKIDTTLVYVERLKDRNWRIHEDNMGPGALEFFGSDDVEFWIDIEDEHMLKVFALVAENSFNKDEDRSPLSLSKLKNQLNSKGIPFSSGSWQ